MPRLQFSRYVLFIAIFLLYFPFLALISNFTLSDLFFTVALLMLVISLIGGQFISEYFLYKNHFIIPILIFSLGFFLSINFSTLPIESITAFLQILFIFLIVYPIIRIIIQDKKDSLAVIYLLVFPGLLISVAMLIFYFISIDKRIDLLSLIEIGWGGRLSFGGMEPNIPARILLQILPLCMILAYKSKSVLVKTFFTIFIAIIILTVFLTASRSSLLILIMGFIVFTIFHIKMKRRISIPYLLLYIIIQFSLFQFVKVYNNAFYDKPLERYSTILNPKTSDSSIERLEIIDKGFDIINKNPLIGVGLENSSLITEIYVHNPIILTWVENGILGMIGFGLIYLILLIIGLKCYRNNFFNDDILMAFTVIMIMMIFGDMFMANSYKRILWIPALMMVVNYDRLSRAFK